MLITDIELFAAERFINCKISKYLNFISCEILNFAICKSKIPYFVIYK